MYRRTLHILMAVALCACIASLISSARSRSQPCPICGGAMERIGAMRSLSLDRSRWRTFDVHRCFGCDYEVVIPAASGGMSPDLLSVPD